MLYHPKIDVNATDEYGASALHRAIQRPLDCYWTDIVTAMLQHPRIDVKVKDACGECALAKLICCVEVEQIAMLQRLLQHPRIDVNAKDNAGVSILEKAIDTEKLDPTEAVLICFKKLFEESEENELATIQLLLQHPQIDVNVKNNTGVSILEKAIEREKLGAVDLLLQHPKIDVNIKNSEGICVLEKAIDRENVNIIECLLQHPQMIEVSRQDTQRLAALGYVVRHFTLPVLKWLGFSFVTIGLANTNKTFQIRIEDSLHYLLHSHQFVGAAASVVAWLSALPPRNKLALLRRIRHKHLLP